VPRRLYLAGRAASAIALAAIVIVVLHLLAAAGEPALREPAMLLRSLLWTTVAAVPATLVGLVAGLVARSRRWGLALAGCAYLALVGFGVLGAVARPEPLLLVTIAAMAPTFDTGLLAATSPGRLSAPVLLVAFIALSGETLLLVEAVAAAGRRALRPAPRNRRGPITRRPSRR
jgi:hypothetical protein